MANDPDPLSREVSVSVRLDETGLTASGKSRFVAAIDRLIGAMVDVPAAKMESIAVRIRQNTKVDLALSDEQLRLAQEKLGHVDGVEHPLIENFIREQLRKQGNLHEVGKIAVAELRSPPANQISSIGESVNEVDDATDQFEDWLNAFTAHAEKASSEYLQTLWAKVLSGEVRRQGTFSRTTLRILAEIDQQTAQLFLDAARERLEEGCIPSAVNADGVVQLDLAYLEEVGLLLEAANGLSISRGANEGDEYVDWPNGEYVLRCYGVKQLAFGIIRITRMGQQICTILPPIPGDVALRKVALMVGPKCSKIELYKFIDRASVGPKKLQLVEVLQDKFTSNTPPPRA